LRQERLAKIGNAIPHRFQILGNGESFCTAGIKSGVLSVMLTWVRRDPAACPPHLRESDEDSEGGDVDLHVGGLENDAHIDWRRLYVDVGDEITVRVLGPGPFDPPQHREERLRIPHDDQTVVTASRITLRTPVPEDLDFVSRLLGSIEVMAHVQTPLNHEESKRWLERYQTRSPDDRGMLMIVDNESKALVGVTGTIDTEVGGEVLPVVQCLIGPSHWRQGYGTDAAWIAVGMAHNPSSWVELEPNAAYAMIRPSNLAGLALARKFGMKCLRSVQYQGQEHHLFVAELREKS
jgi:RimJ/RimL family protein N-acetyltransferase